MIDFHTHILPEVDDGSVNAQMSVAMLKELKNQGIKKVVLTPHFYAYASSAEVFAERRETSKQELLLELQKNPVDIELYLGCEVLYFEELWRIESLKDFSIKGTEYILVEMPFVPWPENMVRGVEKLIGKGFTSRHKGVILASRLADSFLNSLTVLIPIALEMLAEIFDRFNIVISKKIKTLLSLAKRRADYYVSLLTVYLRICRDSLSLCGKIKISPIYTVVVSAFVKRLLDRVTHLHSLYALAGGYLKSFNRRLSRAVKTKLLTRSYTNAYIMSFSVDRFVRKRHIRYGACQKAVIVGQNGCGKHGGQTDTVLFKYRGSRERIDIKRHLYHLVRVAAITEEGIFLSVDSCRSKDRIILSCPMHSFCKVQGLIRRPYREKGIYCY